MKKNLTSKKNIKKSKVSKKYTKIQHGGNFEFNDIKTIEEIQKTFLEDIDCTKPIDIIYKQVVRLIHPDKILRILKVKYPNESKNDIKLKYDALEEKYGEYTKAVNSFKEWAEQNLSEDITWDNAIKEAKILLSTNTSNSSIRSSNATDRPLFSRVNIDEIKRKRNTIKRAQNLVNSFEKKKKEERNEEEKLLGYNIEDKIQKIIDEIDDALRQEKSNKQENYIDIYPGINKDELMNIQETNINEKSETIEIKDKYTYTLNTIKNDLKSITDKITKINSKLRDNNSLNNKNSIIYELINYNKFLKSKGLDYNIIVYTLKSNILIINELIKLLKAIKTIKDTSKNSENYIDFHISFSLIQKKINDLDEEIDKQIKSLPRNDNFKFYDGLQFPHNRNFSDLHLQVIYDFSINNSKLKYYVDTFNSLQFTLNYLWLNRELKKLRDKKLYLLAYKKKYQDIKEDFEKREAELEAELRKNQEEYNFVVDANNIPKKKSLFSKMSGLFTKK